MKIFTVEEKCPEIVRHAKEVGVISEMRYFARKDDDATKDWKAMASNYRIKPILSEGEPEIYQTLLSRYDLKADECVFIDDTEDNVRSAEKLGFAGIVFTGYEDTVERLDEILK